jgi:hypothetical protein
VGTASFDMIATRTPFRSADRLIFSMSQKAATPAKKETRV